MPTEKDAISPSHLATGRAVDQLRRQLGIVLKEKNGGLLGACPVEGITPKAFATLPKKGLELIITAARARAIGLVTQDKKVVCIAADRLSLKEIQALADPLAPIKKSPKTDILKTIPAHHTLMTLTKYATLLPALLIVKGKTFPKDWLAVAAQDIERYWKNPPLDMVPLVEANLPVKGAENTKILCFRSRWGTSMHLALVVGKIKENPLVRVHSSCITGDILGSLRCDCGDQLRLAMERMTEEGTGILIYLHQEGRGIGIANKLRAYALQEQGVDTYDANLMLGFDEDERDFAIAAKILKKLKIKSCRLLTNNPRKLENLNQYGITITERVKLAVSPGLHNHHYLNAKVKKSGHLL